ncbi:DUF2195 family protein [Methylomonas sp. LW13]|nr:MULTISPECIES: DUF2195 family protein [unclassified Methylomonas]PKD41295.1 DUF2195 domain-containing protein [Methylomonas sp. Kb3]QBC26138.1 DUF2195 family protein [Methylomonas sp. LW13]
MLMGDLLMVARKISVLGVFFIVSCAIANEPESIQLNNQLSACIAVNDIQTSIENGIPVLSFDAKIIKSIAECGCKSALGSYSVMAKMAEYQSYIIVGKVAFTKSEHKYWPLSAEQGLIDKRKLEIVLSCAQPD